MKQISFIWSIKMTTEVLNCLKKVKKNANCFQNLRIPFSDKKIIVMSRIYIILQEKQAFYLKRKNYGLHSVVWYTLFKSWATFKDPLRNEMRFLQTGMRIIIQLRLRQAALARATGRASWRTRKFDLFLECCEVLIHNTKKNYQYMTMPFYLKVLYCFWL